MTSEFGLEHKYCGADGALTLAEEGVVEGYASVFGDCDHGGDVVEKGAYAASLARLASQGGSVKMLWQHNPAEPIGVWDEVREDDRGLWVKGRILTEVSRGREAAALIRARAIEGLSIGFRTLRAAKNEKGQRLLTELELWEVSLVTFPMLSSARVSGKGDSPETDALRDLACMIDEARLMLADAKRARH